MTNASQKIPADSKNIRMNLYGEAKNPYMQDDNI